MSTIVTRGYCLVDRYGNAYVGTTKTEVLCKIYKPYIVVDPNDETTYTAYVVRRGCNGRSNEDIQFKMEYTRKTDDIETRNGFTWDEVFKDYMEVLYKKVPYDKYRDIGY